MDKIHTCPTCQAEWIEDDLIKPGKLRNIVCQSCGFDARLHGTLPMIFTIDNFNREHHE